LEAHLYGSENAPDKAALLGEAPEELKKILNHGFTALHGRIQNDPAVVLPSILKHKTPDNRASGMFP